MRRASLATIAAVQIGIFLAGLVLVELVLRQFFPLPPHGGEYRDAQGQPVRIARDANTLQPELDVRHIASEFSARIHTDDLGYRRMSRESRAPDFLFMGDSFTFGHGVSDQEVFSEVFCNTRQAACLNLGRSGTNTFEQVGLLRHGIETYRLRPATVVLTMLAACWLGVAGNDLGDNLAYFRNTRRNGQAGSLDDVRLVRAGLALSPADTMRTLQGWLSQFEITKRAMTVASGGLKRGVYACSAPGELDAAASATAIALRELAQLAEQQGFRVIIVVIHPFQDLAGGFATSEAAVARALPGSFACISTGAQFVNDSYYPYDGHFNASGHARLAAILNAAMQADTKSSCRELP